jgi:hypothetical protein
VWAYGLRNPFRFSFDSANGDLYIGDVGQEIYEEINFHPGIWPGGANYGWDVYEGDHCPNPSCSPADGCAIFSYQEPILEYNQQIGNECAVTGGYVYRGCRMPGLHGTYFYSDFCSSFIRTFEVVDGIRTNDRDRTAELAPGGALAINLVSSFGQDARGELYVVDRSGELFRIVPAFPSLEVSGVGALEFELGEGEWVWEDLTSATGYPVSAYRVYRSESPSGPFSCVLRTEIAAWKGGDAAVPTAGGRYFYLVLAELQNGTLSSPGSGTSGALRSLSNDSCPLP